MPHYLSTREELLATARSMNLFSDLFMSVVLDDKEACAYVLRILTEIPTLTVIEIRTQYRVNNLTARDVIFDVLAQDDEGKLYNIEIQRADTVNHPRRVALYCAELIMEYMKKGTDVDDTPEVYIFYISETDVMKTKQCISSVEKKLAGSIYDDGVHIAYANAEVDDGSNVASLMQYFKSADPNDEGHGALSKRIRMLKTQKEGEDIMCKVSDKIFAEGKVVGRLEDIINLTEAMHLTDEQAMDVFKIEQKDRPLYAAYVKEMRAERAAGRV